MTADFFETRDAQSRAKHSILRQYAGAWSGIIGQGLLRVQRMPGHRGGITLNLVYVDGFGGKGRYSRDSDQPPGAQTEPIWGSPIIAMQVLEQQAAQLRQQGLSTRLSAVVAEEKPENFEALVDSLRRADLASPIVVGEPLGRGSWDKITVFNDDFRHRVAELLRWVPREAHMLAFIDPYGPAMPLDALGRLLGRQKTDAISLFPYHDLARKGGSAGKTESQMTSNDHGNITRITNHFGTEEWKEILRRETTPARREAALVALYLRQLRGIDPDLFVKNIALRFSERDQTAYHLCLTTRHQDGALRMTDILRKTEVEEKWEVWRDREERARQREEDAGVQDLFGGTYDRVPQPVAQKYQPELAEVVEDVRNLCPPGTYTWRQILHRLADTVYTETEISAALRELKKQGRAQFTSLSKRDAMITLVR